jgi:hypothetical protein
VLSEACSDRSTGLCAPELLLPLVRYMPAVQAGIVCVGASRMLAGDSSGVEATSPPGSSNDAAGGGDVAGGDPKKAALGMGLILLSQVRQTLAGCYMVESLSHESC